MFLLANSAAILGVHTSFTRLETYAPLLAALGAALIVAINVYFSLLSRDFTSRPDVRLDSNNRFVLTR
jgi:hypothetical protein